MDLLANSRPNYHLKAGGNLLNSKCSPRLMEGMTDNLCAGCEALLAGEEKTHRDCNQCFNIKGFWVDGTYSTVDEDAEKLCILIISSRWLSPGQQALINPVII